MLCAGVRESGVTIHYVDAGVDTGQIIVQRRVPILPNDTLETFEARIHEMEYLFIQKHCLRFLEIKERPVMKMMQVFLFYLN